ncbi:hypothetical protein GCM10014715_72190 [Streptomyces spiralis]|uniref:Aldo/keto reductase family protein n=1 Tax=Streptomyces spiralis TaxID=66376 RepID=A0A919AH03_9ACTN|nr:hypothetical protein GCM10014715_72190 [Streptomyces spiralis]
MTTYRTLGRTGVKVSPLTLGAMNFGAWVNPDHDDAVKIIHQGSVGRRLRPTWAAGR